jgi:ABC-type lipoprotein release transport system permease subunit
MLWFRIAWRNLWRNRRRTSIQLAAIAGSLFLALFYHHIAVGMYADMIDGGVRSGSGHVGFYHERYLDDRKVSDTVPADALLPQLSRAEGVKAVYARLYVPGLLRSSRNSRPATGMGLDFESEKAHNTLLNPGNLVEGSLPDRPNELVIGKGLAEELQVKVGKKVVWMAQDASGEVASKLFKVSGILHTRVKAIDAGTVLASREALAEVIGRQGHAHEVAVMLDGTHAIPGAMPRLQALAAESGEQTQAYGWQKAMPNLAAIIEWGNSETRMIVSILFILVGIGTLNTMLMSVMERTREFGVIRALGVAKGSIRQMIMAEALVLGLVGSVIGVALTGLVGLYTSTIGMDFSAMYQDMDLGGVALAPVIRTGWDWTMVIGLSIGMIGLSVLASLYPAQRALTIRPADAMRK